MNEEFTDTFEDFKDTTSNESLELTAENQIETPNIIHNIPTIQNHPKTAQQALLIEVLGETIKIQETTNNALINAQKIRLEINKSFEEMEKSISELNTQIEESIKKSGDKASVALATKLDLILQQMTTYQLDSLNKIRNFFTEQGNQLAPEAERTRLENVEIAKAEIDNAKQKSLKEIAVLIDRINGDKLVTKLITYAIVFSIASSLITSSLTYMIITNTATAMQVQSNQTQQTAKHR